MNIVQTLTLKYLKQNKSRTLVTIIGVIISVAMIAATSTIAASFMDMLQRSLIKSTGDWQTVLEGVQSSKVETVTKSKDVKNTLVSNTVGFATLPESKNSQRPYVYINAYDSFSISALTLKEGRFPENEEELAISTQLLDTAGVDYKIGDKITFDIGNRSLNENGTTNLLDNTYTYIKDEVFTKTETREYTITGIVDAVNKDGLCRAGYPVFSGLQLNKLKEKDVYDIFVGLKQVNKNIYNTSEKLQEKAGAKKVDYNSELLLYKGISNDNYFITTMRLATCIVGVIILIGAISLIYNAFAISLSERSRSLGMLASVGATKKQKRNSVLFEAFVIGMIAIPLGLICGYFGIGVTFLLINPIFQDLLQVTVPLKLVISPLSFAGAVLFSILMLLISALFPAIRASRITPIDAIRQSKDINIKKKNVKTSKFTKRLFGFEAELGLKNIKRYKHRYYATLFSMVISIILFLTASAFSAFIKESFVMSNAPIYYDATVSAGGTDIENIKKYLLEIDNLPDKKSGVITEDFYVSTNLDKNTVSSDVKKRIEPNDGKYALGLDIVTMDDSSLKEYAKEAGIDYDILQSDELKGILINTFNLKEKHEFTTVKQLAVKTGTKIPFTFTDEDSKSIDDTIEIAAITDKLPLFMYGYQETISNITILVSEKSCTAFMNKIKEKGFTVNHYYNGYYLSDAPSNFEKSIESIKINYPDINSYTYNVVTQRQKQQNLSLVFNVFLYGFVILIAIVCTANIMNTISTGVNMRKREFAMLKSYGITPAGFRKMIRYECIFYGIKALLYGLPISFFTMWFIYNALSRNFDFQFFISWTSIFIAVVGVFFIISMTMMNAIRKTKNDNIIDTLKSENL